MVCAMNKAGRKSRITTREIVIFPMLAVILFLGDLLMDWAPNVHFVGMLVTTYTLVYRKKALFPIYIYILLTGIYAGFNAWWVPYLYLWAILWGAVMLLPRNMPRKVAVPVYMIVTALHGLTFGILYAPFQALAFHLGWKGMIAWIVSGFPMDVLHCVSNFFTGTLIVPLAELIRKIDSRTVRS